MHSNAPRKLARQTDRQTERKTGIERGTTEESGDKGKREINVLGMKTRKTYSS